MAGGESPSGWQALVSTALLGVERAGAALPKANGGAGALLDAVENGDPASGMLASVAVLSVYQRAGWRPAAINGEVPDAVSGDDLPACSDRARRQLAEALHGDFKALLPEWCALAAAAGVRAPDELLPSLLRRLAAPGKALSAELVKPILGARGTWLAARNPDWARRLAGEDHEAAWHDGGLDQRREALGELRRRDPEGARALLEESWPDEAAQDREKLLPVLEHGLSMADEPFLEAALDDSISKVREAAALLLSRLPESRYAGRMAERAGEVLSLSAKKGLVRDKVRLEVALPGELNKAMRRDGLSARQRKGLGKKAALLFEILRNAPLAAWDAAAPADWIAAAEASDWAEPLIGGWAEASSRQGNGAWADALLDRFARSLKPDKDLERYGDALAAAASAAAPEAREAAAARRLGDGNFDVAAAFLAGCDHPWSTAFSRRVLDALKRQFPARRGDYDWRLRDRVKGDFARRLAPEIAAAAAEGWDRNARGWSSGLDEMLEVLSATLNFRSEMRKELSP